MARRLSMFGDADPGWIAILAAFATGAIAGGSIVAWLILFTKEPS